MITLKHLCRDYNRDPYPLRMFLRQTFGKRNRWRWDPDKPEDMEDLATIKKAIETQDQKS